MRLRRSVRQRRMKNNDIEKLYFFTVMSDVDCTCIFCNIEDVGDFRNYVYNIWFYIWSHSRYN